MWRLSLGRVSEPSHSLEQNCSVCSLSLPENCSLSLIIAENRQSKEEKLSPLLLGQRAASLQPDTQLAEPGLPELLPVLVGMVAQGKGGWAGSRTGFVTLGQWSALLAVPSFLPGNLSAQMESAIRSFVSFPKHTAHSLPV